MIRNINKLFLALLSALALTSCAEHCNIAGNSTVSDWDGQTVYLRHTEGGRHGCNIDSCIVEHGRFSFLSSVDSVIVVQLFMGNESQMPLVLENGELNIEIGHGGRRVSGTPLNERFYRFMQKRNQLENRQWELNMKSMRMMHEGKSPEKIYKAVGKKLEKLIRETEELETQFIIDNYDNPLGPGCFMWLFGQYPAPIMTEQIESIIDNAPHQFLNAPFVKSYLRRVHMR